jgi:hypothetical protein
MSLPCIMALAASAVTGRTVPAGLLPAPFSGPGSFDCSFIACVSARIADDSQIVISRTNGLLLTTPAGSTYIVTAGHGIEGFERISIFIFSDTGSVHLEALQSDFVMHEDPGVDLACACLDDLAGYTGQPGFPTVDLIESSVLQTGESLTVMSRPPPGMGIPFTDTVLTRIGELRWTPATGDPYYTDAQVAAGFSGSPALADTGSGPAPAGLVVARVTPLDRRTMALLGGTSRGVEPRPVYTEIVTCERILELLAGAVRF